MGLKYRFPFSPSSIIGLSYKVRMLKETRKALDPTNIERITRPKRKDRMKTTKRPTKKGSMNRTKRKMQKKGKPRKYRNRR